MTIKKTLCLGCILIIALLSWLLSFLILYCITDPLIHHFGGFGNESIRIAASIILLSLIFIISFIPGIMIIRKLA